MFQIPKMVETDAFREETRRWLEQSCPPSMRTPPTDGDDGVWGGRKTPPTDPDARAWLERMAERGWTRFGKIFIQAFSTGSVASQS